MHITHTTRLIMAALAGLSLPAAATPLLFNDTRGPNDLVGSLVARVQFAQSQILPAHPGEGDRQPTLTALRKSLLLVQPLQADGVTPMQLEARNGSGQLLGTNSHLFINGMDLLVSRGVKKSFTSDGQSWLEVPLIDTRVARKPVQFGVPVTTLVGYYDPQGSLPSYLYPALHGAYGFTYPDDGTTLADSDCQLQVETRDGVLRFRLANHRSNGAVMNKFHINVPIASEPRRASLLCRGQPLAQEGVLPPPAGLAFNVYGRALTASSVQ